MTMTVRVCLVLASLLSVAACAPQPENAQISDGIYLVEDGPGDAAIPVSVLAAEGNEWLSPKRLMPLRVTSAEAKPSEFTGDPVVEVVLAKYLHQQFADVTREHRGSRLAFVVDGTAAIVAKVMTPILGGKLTFETDKSAEAAATIAERLRPASD